MRRLLRGGPGGIVLVVLLAAVLLGLAFAPIVFPGSRSLNVAAKICVFVLLAASYDLLLGYTGIVSFAHTMFFGIGSYGVAIAMTRMGAHWPAFFAGVAGACVVSLALSLTIGLFSLRVRAIFFAMITLAIASFFSILASQLSGLTGGEDGLTFRMPALLSPGNDIAVLPLLGFTVTGKTVAYWLVFGGALAGYLALARIVASPFGRVLQAIRENEFRAEAVGFRTVHYQTAANVIAALAATLAGVLHASWLRYSGPDVTLSFAVMIDILLMVVIGGMGTMTGAVLGATLLVLAQSYLQDLMQAASDAAAAAGVPLLPTLLDADRWLLWLGVLFVLCVYFLPAGLVGRLRIRRAGPDTIADEARRH
ncbi:MAG: branched-chain amino acid ABC transporter permease [Lautropia sp.]